ncbi:MAG: hypothetical protein ACSLFQ_22415 [Thermoanaerobaculia bacterium]
MNYVVSALVAQLDAETRIRLRSATTAIAVLAMFAIAFTYIPDPSSSRVSISWESNGVRMSGLYSSAYIGWVVAMLTSIMLPFAGFYLVTGSVKRDLDRRIWPIVAATPTPRIAYLAGKMLAGFSYLMILGAVSLIPATLLFFRYGHGPFEPLEIVKPWLLLVPPSLLFTSAMALLFDVTPGFRGRGGYVVWFFAWVFLFLLLPGKLAGVLDEERAQLENPAFDPSGIVMVESAIEGAVGAKPKAVNLGVIILNEKLERVEFPGVPVSGALVAVRVAQFGWSAAVLGMATLVFPFGAAMSSRASLRRKAKKEPGREDLAGAREPAMHVELATRASHPSFARSAFADAALIWQTASWLKWPMAIASLGAFVVPATAAQGFIAAVLILCVIVISESAAREALAGTSGLVFAQPGVPRSQVAWKLASVGLFAGAVLASMVVRAALAGPERLAAALLGALFVVTASVGLGWLTKGGKFFSAIFTAAWYVAVQGAADFTGVFAKTVDLQVCASFAIAGIALSAAAWSEEMRRRRS